MPPKKTNGAKGPGGDRPGSGSSKSGTSPRKSQEEGEADDYNAAILEILNESQAKIAAALEQRQNEVLGRIGQCEFALTSPRKGRR
jgi:hypothetical protein